MIKMTSFALPPYYHDRSTAVISIHRQDTHTHTEPRRKLQHTHWVGRNDLIKPNVGVRTDQIMPHGKLWFGMKKWSI